VLVAANSAPGGNDYNTIDDEFLSPSGSTSLLVERGAPLRSLAVVTSSFVGTSPGLALTVAGKAVQGVTGQSVAVPAGTKVSALDIVLAGSDTFAVTAARLKLVQSTVTTASAQSGACTNAATSLGLNRATSPFGDALGSPTQVAQGTKTLKATPVTGGLLSLRMGGSYKVCYSDDGKFGASHADVVPVTVDAPGVYDPCTGDDCLALRQFKCHALKSTDDSASYGASDTCAVQIAALHGTPGKVTLSQAFRPKYSGDVFNLTSSQTRACGAVIDTAVFCPHDGINPCEGADFYSELDQGNTRALLPRVRTKTNTKRTSVSEPANALAACYCPNYNGCDGGNDFPQQIGIVLVFVAKICHPVQDKTNVHCAEHNGYSGVTPNLPFKVMVHCPWNGCTLNDNSRLKIVDYNANNDKPSWDAANGCRTAVQTSLYESPFNCKSPTECSLKGGSSQIYKSFGDTAGMRMTTTGVSPYENMNYHTSLPLDVCFCGDNCGTATNWFKVGRIVRSPLRLMPFQSCIKDNGSPASCVEKTAGDNQYTTKIDDWVVNVPTFAISLARSSLDKASLGLSANTILKVLSDPTKTVTDAICGSNPYPTGLISSFTAAKARSTNYVGVVSGGKALRFGGGTVASNDNWIALTPGPLAICYCAEKAYSDSSVWGTNPCEDSSQWALAARYIVRGPTPNQAWSFSTHIVVRLSCNGHGLASTDTLRIVSNSIACTSSSNNPKGDTQTELKIGCPDDTCSAMGDRNLALKIADQDSVGCDEANLNCQKVYVRAVTVISATATEVEFTSDPHLSTGDVIVLEDNVACLSNCDSVKLAAVTGTHIFGDDSSTKYHVGHKVKATSDVNKFTIPIGWSSPDVPLFIVQDVNGVYGKWRRTNIATSKQELTAGSASGGPLKVCWSYGGDHKYVAQVGQITFTEPAKMPAVQVYFLTNKQDVTAPVIIGFTTGNGNAVAAAYGQAVNSMQLKILVTPTTKLDFHYADQDMKQLADVSTEDEMSEAQQSACAKLFMEMWSIDDTDGFPLPKGCYYKRRTKTTKELEIGIVFDPKNGLKPGKKYQIVLNAHAYPTLTKSTKILKLFSMEDTVLKPYEAVEIGEALPSVAVKPAATGTDAQFQKPGGLTILGGTDSLLELKGDLKLRIELAGDAKGKIVKDTILKIFMFPLTQWDMGYSGETSECDVQCTPHPKLICGTPSTCTATVVQQGAQSNVIYIKLPSEMDDIYDTIKHQFYITKLTLPAGGYFPNRVAAQIGKQDDTKPDYVISGGAFLWKQPNSGVTIGELVTRPGDGNDKPFKEDVGNTVYARLLLGATLHAAREDGEASFSISLPPGYTCVHASEVPTTLEVFGGVSPQGRGTLNMMRWSYDTNKCHYYMKKNDVVYAGSALMIKLTVNNPETALPRTGETNQWTVVLRGRGLYTSEKITEPSKFQKVSKGTEATDFGSNVAVVGKLSHVSIQPTDFRISQGGILGQSSAVTITQELYVFFKAEQTAGFESSVLLQGPLGYDFGAQCEPGMLPSTYYVVGLVGRTYPLPETVSCTGGKSGASTAFNRAEIKLSGLIHPGRQYGFKIKVINPESYKGDHHNQWELWTKDKNNYYVDGSYGSPRFNGDSDSKLRSWGLYQKSLNVDSFPLHLAVSITPLLPFSLTKTEATITIFPLRVVMDVDTALRITAPQGYEWFFSNQDFTYRSASTTNSTSLIVPKATADLPAGIPTRYKNELRWATASYKRDQIYGFITRIRVPDQSPRSSSNAFFVEFGYDEDTWGGQQRSMAARLEAPMVHSLQNAHVGYLTNVVGKTNTLRFQVQTATNVPNKGGLTITGPSGFFFPESCRPTPVGAPANAPLPTDLNCNFRKTSDGKSQIRLIAGESGIPPGLYVFELTGDNPKIVTENLDGEDTRCGMTQCWIFKSVTDVEGFTSFEDLDMETSAVGFAINNVMISAGMPLLDEMVRIATGRNDRPGQSSQLIFYFQLNHDVEKQSVLKLRGPEGYVFAEDCLKTIGGGGVITDGNLVFGNKESFIPGFDAWELGVLVFSCTGDGPNANLGIGAGLQRNKKYVFRIKVASNPIITPQQNKWTIDFSDESSEPFDGFSLWTFTKMSATTVSTAMSPEVPKDSKKKVERAPNLVTVKFRPYNLLNKDYPEKDKTALLTVTAPSGFVFASVKKKCTIILEEADFITSATPLLPFDDADYTCTVPSSKQNQLLLEMISDHGLSSGRDYTITLEVMNPTTAQPKALPWTLETSQGTRSLDSGTLTGFAVNKVLMTWSYDNKNALGEAMVNGNMLIDGLLLTMRFPDKLQKLDQIIIHAPPGFILTDPKNKDGQKKCYNFKWEPVDAEYFKQSPVTCEKNRMTFLIMEVKPFPEGNTIKFRIDTVNPTKTPETTSNYWSIVHQSAVGETMSSDVFKGWTVVPQLEGVGVKLLGPKMSARSMSEIEITFETVSDAESFEITAKRPIGFDFSSAVVSMTGQAILQTSQASARVQMKIQVGQAIVSRLRDVKLGMLGGATMFDLTTYKGDTKVDQKLSFEGGFRLPGKVTVLDSLLQSEFNLNSALYPVKSLWHVQRGSPAVASFTIEMTYPVKEGNSLIISTPTYVLKLEGFILKDSQTTAVIPSEVLSAKEGRLVVQLKEKLLTQRQYHIVMHTVTPVDAPLEMWRVETSDGGPLPTNTNDGMLQGFSLVSGMDMKVTAPRSPPMAEIEVSLLIDPQNTVPTSLVLVAPLGFNFTTNCLVTGAGFILGCEPSRSIAGLPTATLACRDGGLNEVIRNLRVKVTTPDATPNIRSWYVMGKFAETDEQVGWGQDPEGFEVNQMEDTSVEYAGMQLIDTQMVVQFKTREQMDLGAQIKVLNPPDYTVRCSGDEFNSIYLPGILECTTRRGFFTLALNDTLAPGSYAFSVMVETPRTTPGRRLSGNKFSLLLLDKNQQVQDASMNMAGQEIRQDFVAQAIELSWTSSEAGQASSITIGFKVRTEIGRGIVADFLIMLPMNYAHAIEKKDAVRSLNSLLPLREVGTRGWVDFRMMDRLVIHLDPNREIPVGEYKFIFPVTVPEQMPVGNFWRVSLCGYSDSGPCLSPESEQALVTFPLAGFKIGQLAPGQTRSTSDKKASSAPLSFRHGLMGLGPLLTAALLTSLPSLLCGLHPRL
jgi:hypothetical protein